MKAKGKSNKDTESDDEIWDYRPVKRVKKKDPGKSTPKTSTIAHSKVTAKRKTESTLIHSTGDDSSENDVQVLGSHDNNKTKTDLKKSGAAGDEKNVKLKGSITRRNLALIKSNANQNEASTSSEQSLHNSKQRGADNVDLVDNRTKTDTSHRASNRLSQESATSSQSAKPAGSKSSTKRRSSTKKKPQQTPRNKLLERPRHEGSCPFCQMPFAVLTIESPRWHVTECMDLPLIATQECPGGVQCDSTFAGHFRKFRHTLLANVRAGLAEATENTEEQDHKHFSRKLNFDSGSKTKSTTTATSMKTTTVTNSEVVVKSETRDTHDMFSAETQVVTRSTCTRQLNVTNSANRLSKKLAQKRKGGALTELTVDAVTKKLFQTPVKEEVDQGSGDNDDEMGPNDKDSIKTSEDVQSAHFTTIKEESRHEGHDGSEDDMFTIRKDSANLTLYPTPVKENTKSCNFPIEIEDSHSSKAKRNTDNSKTPKDSASKISANSMDSDIDSDQDVFSGEEITIKVGDGINQRNSGNQTGNKNTKKVSTESMDEEVDVFSEDENDIKKMKVGGVFTFNPDRNISDMLADALATTEDDTQDDSCSEPYDGTESSVAGDEEDVVDIETLMVSDTQIYDNQDSMATVVEETQEDDRHRSIHVTRGINVVKETQLAVGCYRDTAKNTLVDADNRSRELNETVQDDNNDDDDGDDDVLLVDVENYGVNNAPSFQSSKQEVIANSESSRKRSRGERNRRPRVKRSRSMRFGKQNKLMNAAVDSRQSSVLDFFGTKRAKANPGTDKTDDPENSMSTVNIPMATDADGGTSTATSTCSSVNSTGTPGPSKPWPVKSHATSKAGITPQSWTNKYNASVSNGGWWGRGANRQCPFYKKIPGTPFTVDAFRYGSIPDCKAYFLTHFHYDHYGGLTKKFKHPVYCSKVTANLVRSKLRVEEQFINVLPMNKEVTVEGVKVTLLEANHCPGSVLFLFELPNGQTYLHTGDFRATTDMESYPELIGRKIHQLYLDTTYCDPAYAFPPQMDVIKFAVNLVRDAVYENPNMLVITGSYTIGKERIFMAIAEELNSKVCVTCDKWAILECLEDPEIKRRMTLEKAEARVHVLPMDTLGYEKLSEYLEALKPKFDSILAISPTGWTHNNKTVSLDKIRPKMKRGNITIYGLPYSEHSSFTELRRFVQFVRPERTIATVNNGNPASRRKMDNLFHSWLNESNTPKKEAKQRTLTSWFK